MADAFAELHGLRPPDWFAAADPPAVYLGSGGATAHLLIAAWQATGRDQTFEAWLEQAPKLVIHGGGQSRRLPSYAAVGKPLIPIPVFRGSRGQRLDQTLLDLQLPAYHRVLNAAPARSRVLVTSGDVFLRFGTHLPVFPDVDVLGLGMDIAAEQAQDFGVFFTSCRHPTALAFFLQKPSAHQIHELATDHLFLVDTGMWLLSPRAIDVLLRKSGRGTLETPVSDGVSNRYELYAQFALSLGENPSVPDPDISRLTSAVIPLPEAEFYHLGTTRQLLESVSLFHRRGEISGRRGYVGAWGYPDQHVLNSRFAASRLAPANHTLWIENSVVPESWTLAHGHALTNVPPNDWTLSLEPGVCLDFVPVDETALAVRVYALDDPFRGPLGDPLTLWLGRPAGDWFNRRALDPAAAGLDPTADIQASPLFPVLPLEAIDGPWLEWLFAANPEPDPAMGRRWIEARRMSADQLVQAANLRRLYRQRASLRDEALRAIARNRHRNVFYRLDLERTASSLVDATIQLSPPTPAAPGTTAVDPMQPVRERMVQACLGRHRAQPGWDDLERAAFDTLRSILENEARLEPAAPRCNVQEDQIVWSRSPARLDLAGGWTDTPPYCLEHGGHVVNVAVDLNGQPPLQAFVRLCREPHLVIRSIDLGAEQRVNSYESLATFDQPGSEFALAKAAFALAGFHPRFHATGGYPSLPEQLSGFGGGLELSMLAAVPKGSGLGTSSILAATLLAGLSDFCGLGWDRHVLFARTLALEQMMTTGGGWQDQAGGLFRGIKSIETAPGLVQTPSLRWLPDYLFAAPYANQTVLLYYTGVTRLAKGILHEVVRGVFLNSPQHLEILEAIRANATLAFAALQEADCARLGESIRISWDLNQRLDAATNPPEIQAILDQVSDYLEAAKLLGAGGGGYLLMLAKDVEAGARIRRSLTEDPPNARARFVEFAVSDTGLQVTRS